MAPGQEGCWDCGRVGCPGDGCRWPLDEFGMDVRTYSTGPIAYSRPSGIGKPITKKMLLKRLHADRSWDPARQQWVYEVKFHGWSTLTMSRDDYDQIRAILGQKPDKFDDDSLYDEDDDD